MRVLEIEFFDNITVVGQVETNIGPVFELAVADIQPIRFPQVSRKIVDELTGSSGKGANKMYQRFQRAVERSRYTPEMLEQSHADLLDKQYIVPAIKGALSVLAPDYKLPEPFTFRLEPILKGGTYKVATNIDFGAANGSFNKHAPGNFQSVLTVPYLLGFIADTRRDLIVGSRHQSEFVMAPERAVVASCKFAEVLSAAGHGLEVAEAFQEAAVDAVPSIRDAVNSGNRSFRDVIQLLSKAEKFKEWLRKQGATEDLRSAYLQEIAHLDWTTASTGDPPLRVLSSGGSRNGF